MTLSNQLEPCFDLCSSPRHAAFAAALPSSIPALSACPCCSAVYIAPLEALAKERLADWSKRFGAGGLGLNVVQLTGEAQADLKLLEKVRPGSWQACCRPGHV